MGENLMYAGEHQSQVNMVIVNNGTPAMMWQHGSMVFGCDN